MVYSDDLNIVKTNLMEMAKQANSLALGLQNAAPPQDSGPSPSVRYLFETTDLLQEKLKMIDQLIGEKST